MKRKMFAGGIVAGAAISGLAASHAQATTFYDSTPLSSTLTTDTHYAAQITLPAGPASYDINTFTHLGINWNVTAGAQTLDLDFYSNADLSPTSANVLGPATLIDHESVSLAGQSAGPLGYNLSFGSIDVPDTFTLVVTLNNAADTGPSTALGGIFTQGALPVGADTGYVWIDSAPNSNFTGAEQNPTVGGGSPSHIFVNIGATGVPEPVSGSLIFGMAALGLMRRRARH